MNGFDYIFNTVFFRLAIFCIKRRDLKRVVLLIIFSLLTFKVMAWNKPTHGVINNMSVASVESDAERGLHIIYYHYFPRSKSCLHTTHGDCTCLVKSASEGRNTTTLKCTEHLELLVPETKAKKWLSRQKKQGYFYLTVSQFGVYHVPAHIINTVSFNHLPARVNSQNINAGIVTALSKRHTLNIRKYRIKNKHTNAVTSLTVTPDHPFYVLNRHAFTPIKDITADDILITEEGYHAELVCHGIKKNHCSYPWRTGWVASVYNLEIHQKHQYFVSRDKLLVHNTCNLTEYLKRKVADLVFTRGYFRYKRAYLRLRSEKDILRVQSLYKLNGHMDHATGIGFDTLMRASLTTGKPLKIASLEQFLSSGHFEISAGKMGAQLLGLTHQQLIADLALNFGAKIDVPEEMAMTLAQFKENSPAILVSSDNLRMITTKDTGELFISRRVGKSIENEPLDLYWLMSHILYDKKEIMFIVRLKNSGI